MSEKMDSYKLKCKTYLLTIDLSRLRAYGRSIGVARPTALGKEELIEEIVAILAFELSPIEISKRGAPVKNDSVDERIPAQLAEYKAECFAGAIMMENLPEYDLDEELRKTRELAEKYRYMYVNDPNKDKAERLSPVLFRGQVVFEGEEWVLVPFDGSLPEDYIPIPTPLVEECKLREGDLIACNLLEKQGAKKVGKIEAVNHIPKICLKERPNFDECHAQYSKERYVFCGGKLHRSALNKAIDWLYPISKGQRCCVVSAPKAGKTKMLLELANAAADLNSMAEVFVLLVDQTPETVSEFRRKYDELRVVATTYEDDPDRQVYVADMLLKRAKRFAEFGKDVFIFVDSLSALARAFNDTEASMGGKTLPCGLEVKTIHYLKKYLGTARALEEGGSITIMGAINAETANPMDDIISRELTEFATLKVELNDGLALRRIYPAIDFEKTQAKYNAMIKSEEATQLDAILYSSILPRVGLEGVLNMLNESPTKSAFMEKIKNFN